MLPLILGLVLFIVATSAMGDPMWPPSARPPFRTDIPEPVLVDPPAEHLTEEGVYIPPSIKPYVKVRNNHEFSHIRQLYLFHDAFRVRRWKLPSWGWVGIRTHYGHSDADWETFRRKIVGAYHIYKTEEGEKFRILWIEDRDKLDNADDDATREAFKNWFLDHSDPPDGHYSLIPTIKKVWSGYEENVCLVADKETIDSVLADTSHNLDEIAFIKLLDRHFDEQDMRKWAPKLVGRYTGSFKVSPHYLPSLDGVLTEDDSYGQPGHSSTWYLRAAKMQDGVFRQQNHAVVDEDFGKDPINLGEDSSDEESEESADGDSDVRDEL
ncbi:uncharacterized protein BDR25DRAFT_341746 [Lindgomyces ingoldianus]|uniref:Uncharacterized protein n=1 Tax=Lindgomyces ingoldianus TaxID=673940 RepID=A0ACB6R1L4_9PLEO|nr:uncharacterized protein BDR25DRAFT_341746 [Lindgomyces ingoldianus]KAF2472980.1 hypothetical protein BDR25DRAFT_341746 [Lindgomyces ingoldianus]